MKSIDRVSAKLKLMYYSLFGISNVYTKDEAIELFSQNQMDLDSNIIIQRAFSYADCKESACFDFGCRKDSIKYSSEIVDVLSMSDEKYFYIDISYNQTCKNASKLLYNDILKRFSIDEYPDLIQLLISECKNFNKNFKSNVDYNFKYLDTILTSDNVLGKFINDKDFGIEMTLIYVYNAEEMERKKHMDIAQEKIPKLQVTSINDVARNSLLYMYNASIQNGDLPNNVITIFKEYLCGELPTGILYELFNGDAFGNINFNLISHRNFVKKIMISDYCRFKQIQLEQENIDGIDMQYLHFVESRKVDDIIDRFDNDDNFATNVITDFIIFNNDFDLKSKRNYTKNVKTLKKINPLYQLDFIEFNLKKPKTN